MDKMLFKKQPHNKNIHCVIVLDTDQRNGSATRPQRAAGRHEEQLLLPGGVWPGHHDRQHLHHHTVRSAVRVQREAPARQVGRAQG